MLQQINSTPNGLKIFKKSLDKSMKIGVTGIDHPSDKAEVIPTIKDLLNGIIQPLKDSKKDGMKVMLLDDVINLLELIEEIAS